MARSDILQARGIANIISGGYPGEPHGAQPAFANWEYVDENSNGVESYYFYCDSNYSRNPNARRSQTNVTIKTSWESYIDEFNNVVITTHTFLTRIERIARPGAMPEWNAPASGGDVPSLGRRIYLFKPGTPCSVGAAMPEKWFVPYNYDGLVFSGNIHISDTHRVLAPGQTTGADSAITYRNVVDGYGAYLCSTGTNRYTDAMELGFQFRNNLPTELPRPVLVDSNQTADICENFVYINLIFAAPPVNGAEIYVEWRYEGQDWSSERSASEGAERGKNVTVTISPIAPTNHTDSPQKVYWRAKFRPRRVQMHESEWLYGESISMYVPAPNMSVPDITTEECNAIGKGDLLPEYTKEQCYNDAACADTDTIRQKIKDLNWAKNAECRKINGDNSTKGDD